MSPKNKKTPNHPKHDRAREYPQRGVLNLYNAAISRGLTDVEREFEVFDEEYDRWYWFDVSGFWEGEQYLFDFEPGYHNSRPTVDEKKRLQNKIDWAERAGFPLMIMERGSNSQEMGVLIWGFIMLLKQKV